MKSVQILIVFGSLFVIFGEKARFDNYRVYSIDVENDKQLEVLLELENHQDGLSFMMPPTTNQTFAEIIVPPHKFADINELFDKFEMKNELKIENLQRLQSIYCCKYHTI